jgi:YrbI family 3-deoxy-D-manno-octulosonate 8-phosphate phosphatase
MSDILAIIPARGGSKGIPRKNVRPIVGKPLLGWTIEAARGSNRVNRVAVSTDDPEIAAVARHFGAEVIDRPPEISDDTASSESALLHALDHLRDVEGYEPDLVVFLQATSPFRRPDDIQAAIEKLEHEEADSLFSACPAHGFVWRLHQGRLQPLSYDYRCRPRRQDIGEDFVENGSIYVFRPRILREFNNRLGGKVSVYCMDPLDSFQIDEAGDFERMERLATLRDDRKLRADLAVVSLLVLDFDGVMTDNRVLVSQDGTEAVWCHRGDGWGIARLKERGVRIAVISTETNPVVGARCRKLGLHVVQACDDKLSALRELAGSLGLGPEQIAYVGNDLNDLDCLRWVGFPITVADAVPELRPLARFTTTQTGGHGAVREVADWLIAARDEAQARGVVHLSANRSIATATGAADA